MAGEMTGPTAETPVVDAHVSDPALGDAPAPQSEPGDTERAHPEPPVEAPATEVVAELPDTASADGRIPVLVPGSTLDEQARIVGNYRWIELRLFEILGAWVSSEAVDEARLLFDVYSAQHAWHAELWADRLPVLDEVDPATLTVPPSAEVERLLVLLSGDTQAGGTLLRLVGLARVVIPRLIAGYGVHLRHARPAADGPVVRSLRLVVRDEIESWQVLESLVQTLVHRPHDIAVVTAHQQAMEEVLAGIGPGLVPWSGVEPTA
ncbi:MAG: hypothetical protein ACRDY1_00190 [Acidimicrobiales bacterium]